MWIVPPLDYLNFYSNPPELSLDWLGNLSGLWTPWNYRANNCMFINMCIFPQPRPTILNFKESHELKKSLMTVQKQKTVNNDFRILDLVWKFRFPLIFIIRSELKREKKKAGICYSCNWFWHRFGAALWEKQFASLLVYKSKLDRRKIKFRINSVKVRASVSAAGFPQQALSCSPARTVASSGGLAAVPFQSFVSFNNNFLGHFAGVIAKQEWKKADKRK